MSRRRTFSFFHIPEAFLMNSKLQVQNMSGDRVFKKFFSNHCAATLFELQNHIPEGHLYKAPVIQQGSANVQSIIQNNLTSKLQSRLACYAASSRFSTV